VSAPTHPTSKHPPLPDYFFVQRPVLAMVISILMVIVGLITLRGLAIEQYPSVVPPQIQVSTFFPGASAEVVQQSVASPIEQMINGVDDLLYIRSISGNDGSYTASVYFETGSDQDTSNMLVQNRVQQATPNLPQQVIQYGVTVRKAQASVLLLVSLYSPDGTYDQTFLANYVTLNLLDPMLRVEGVGDARLLSQSSYTMRLWLKPDRMAQLGLDATDVASALQTQNVQIPAGQIGAPPQASPLEFQYQVKAPGFLQTAEEFGNIILRSNPDGSQIRAQDVGRTELGAQSYNIITRMNSGPAAFLGVYQATGGDALRTARDIRALMESLKGSFPPGVDYAISYDTTPPIVASMVEIMHTLAEAMVLVLIVVFLFLQSWRATLIPMLTVPVSLIATFAFFPMLGFSVNVLTMFGMILAIGIVVDDAIVVVEAVMHHMEQGMDRRAATNRAMKEVSGPVVAIALILCAVFVPVAFMGGITGAMFKQFALTIAIAVVISAINALSLSPALCAMLLKPASKDPGPLARLFGAFNRGFDKATRGYVTVSRLFIRRAFLGVIALLAVSAGAFWLFRHVPTGFLPGEDQGVMVVNVQLPNAASLDRTDAVVKQIEALLAQRKEVTYVSGVVGYSMLTGTTSSDAATIFVSFADWAERPAPEQHAFAIIQSVNRELAQIAGAQAFAFPIPPISGLSASGGFTMLLQDRAASTPQELEAQLKAFLGALRQRPEVAQPFSSFSASLPQVGIEVDTAQISKLGLPVNRVYQSLQTFLGGLYVNQFTRFGRLWKVYLQADGEYRRTTQDLGNYFVRANNGEMIPLATLARTTETSGPNYILRFNLFPAAEITGNSGAGFSSGQTIEALKETFDGTVADGFGYDWSGQTFQEIRAQGQQGIVFAMAILFVFLLLAALYESWTLPFSVLLGTPFALLGAMFGTWALGLDNNLYTQIGIVLLIGLAAKNAILIVEFAKMGRDAGKPIDEAAAEAARLRFRPILMTAFAFILGCVPLMLASGSGANSRIALGTGVVFGMSCATVLGVFLIPFLYSVVQKFGERFSGPPKAASAPAPAGTAP